jgi:hypothetical protein
MSLKNTSREVQRAKIKEKKEVEFLVIRLRDKKEKVGAAHHTRPISNKYIFSNFFNLHILIHLI